MSGVYTAAQEERAPDAQWAATLARRSATWLAEDATWDEATGHAWSWRSADGSAYAYPEASAWVVWACARARDSGHVALPEALRSRADGAVDALQALGRAGGVGRGGKVYLFDTAVAAAAVLAWTADRDAAQPLLGVLRDFLAQRRAVTDGPVLGAETAQTVWSEAVGAHCLWACVPLALAGRADVAVQWAKLVVPALAGPPLRHHRQADHAYLHALAYGCAGLATLRGEFESTHARWLQAIAAQLGRSGVAAYSDGTGPRRADTTAQLAQLAAGDAGLAGKAAAALRALAHFAQPDGGMRYEAGLDHVNTWCTAMALQAAAAHASWGRWPR